MFKKVKQTLVFRLLITTESPNQCKCSRFPTAHSQDQTLWESEHFHEIEKARANLYIKGGPQKFCGPLTLK